MSAVTPTTISVLGIVVGQPLSMAECQIEPPSNDDIKLARRLSKRGLQNFMNAGEPKYAVTVSHVCYRRRSPQLSNMPLVTERITVAFPWTERLAVVDGRDVAVQLIDGSVSFVGFRTRGRQWQDEDLMTLSQKFGVPTTVSPISLQNGFGARYQAIKATWKVAPGIDATFKSWINDSNGFFEIGTVDAARRFWQRADLPAKPL